MNIKRSLWIAVLTLTSISCGGDSNGSLVGTWLLSSYDCEGEAFDADIDDFAGLTTKLVVDETTLTITITSDGCEQTNSGNYVQDGNIITTSNNSTACNPNPCTLEYSVFGSPHDDECIEETINTPGEAQIEIIDNTLTMTSSEPDAACAIIYTRQ